MVTHRAWRGGPRAVALVASRRRWAAFLLPVLLAILALTMWKHHEPGVDFHTYEAAARVGMARGWSHIYDQVAVAAAQASLVPSQVIQPFLSPPPVALLAAPLVPLPYEWAYPVWSGMIFLALLLALAWAGTGPGPERWAVALAVVASTWVVHAVHVGQVVPLVAAAVAVSWRLLREHRDLLAGLVLSLSLLKPNTAFLLPVALLFAGRFRVLAGLAIAGLTLLTVTILTVGGEGIATYSAQLTGQLPTGADLLTIKGAFGVDGAAADVMRLVIVGTTVSAAFQLRRRAGLVLAAGALGSLLAAPYLHQSDLCLLTVAAWLVWEEHPSAAWRVPLLAAWFFSAPFDTLGGSWPAFNRWPLVELVILAALAVGGLRRPDGVRFRQPTGAIQATRRH